MNTITITIGRNIPTAGLPIEADEQTWAAFRNDIQTVLENHRAEIFVRGSLGRGEWDGIEEDNATWVAAVDDGHVPSIQHRLGVLAYVYGQDAIALTVGQTTLVEQYTLAV